MVVPVHPPTIPPVAAVLHTVAVRLLHRAAAHHHTVVAVRQVIAADRRGVVDHRTLRVVAVAEDADNIL